MPGWGNLFIRGVVGQIKWSYYTAASINGYAVRRSPTGRWSLRATIVLADSFKMTQRPLHFVAPHATGEWRWEIESLTLATDRGPTQLVATLGPPIEKGLPHGITGSSSRNENPPHLPR
jgi:hypothetical protein